MQPNDSPRLAADEDDPLSVEDEQQLIELLDEFEQLVRGERQPEIEAFLNRAAPHLRKHLLRDLVRLEQELLPVDDRPEYATYLARFPTHVETLHEALRSRTLAETISVGPVPRRVQVGEMDQERLSLMAETAELVRVRLLALSWIVAAGLGIFLLRALLYPNSRLVGLRTAAFAVALVCCWRLGRKRTGLAGPWRLWEGVLILIVTTQTVALQVVETLEAARLGDAVAANAAMLFAFATWSLANMAYAILIPNTWQRAAAILMPLAAIPLAVSLMLIASDRQVAALLRSDYLQAAATLTFLASGTAVAAAYTMHSLRQRLFTARRFGQYRLTKRLGQGGMGEVYLAEHQLLKRPSALKLIRPGLDTQPEALTRFEREVQATANLAHGNTVQIFDYGRTEEGTFYYVMEYLEGCSLQQLVDQHGPLPAGRVVYFLRQVCEALTEAHLAGLVHQDIKPANIFAARCGSRHDVAKLLDFGLVHEGSVDVSPVHDVHMQDGPEQDVPGRKEPGRKEPGQKEPGQKEPGQKEPAQPVDTSPPSAPTGPATPRLTRVVGTPRFLSPEQACGVATPDPRSDIYSLGATAYYLLTGQPVFKRATLSAVLRAHLEDPVRPPSELMPGLPADLEAVVVRCLAKQPGDRYPTARELERALSLCACCHEWSDEAAVEWWTRGPGRLASGSPTESPSPGATLMKPSA